MAEKISRFTILVRDMRAAQKRYFDTRDKADLSRAKELERKVDDELAVIFGGDRTQGSLLCINTFRPHRRSCSLPGATSRCGSCVPMWT